MTKQDLNPQEVLEWYIESDSCQEKQHLEGRFCLKCRGLIALGKQPASELSKEAHAEMCCSLHGCTLESNKWCPVVNKKIKQNYLCGSGCEEYWS